MITLLRDRFGRDPRRWIYIFSVLTFVSFGLTYAFLLWFPINPSVVLANRELGRFTFFNLVAACPFFFAGTVVGLILTDNVARVNTVYAADLAAAAFGCFLSPFLLWSVGAGGSIVFISLLTLAAVVIAAPPGGMRTWALSIALPVGLVGVVLLPRLDQMYPVPGKGALALMGNDQVRLLAPEYSRWSSNSRIDLLPWPAFMHTLFGSGTRAQAMPIPEEKIIYQDCDAATAILNWSEKPELLEAIKATSYSASYRLKDKPRVFVIGLGGGNDVWAAKVNGAGSVRAIELNQQILDIHLGPLARYSRLLTSDPSIEFVCAEGRSALMRDPGTYDVIQMTGIDTWTSLVSGAYMLAENYLYTREAIQTMYQHLAPGGILQITRMARDMEALRLLSNISAAFDHMGIGGLANSVMCIQSDNGMLMTIMVKNGTFTPDEIERTRSFVGDNGLVPIYFPDQPGPGLVQDFVRSGDKARFIREFPRNIAPTTDNSPYFFNYYKWRNLFAAAPLVYEPTFVAQGNPVFILSQLLISLGVAFVLIVLPLALSHRTPMGRAYRGQTLAYFSCLGVGFIFIEIALMQKLTLLLGHPIYSLTVTLFSLLIFTGLGSALSTNWFRSGERLWIVPAGVAVLLLAFVFGSPWMVSRLIGFPLSVRIAATVLVLAPIGLLLGVPFAYGMRVLSEVNPSLVPWAWAVNACLTVIGSILTVILSMNFGFNVVLVSAIVIYGIAFAVMMRIQGRRAIHAGAR